MPDITDELAAIQVATTGSQIRSAIINALSVVNSYIPSEYSGSYTVVPSTSSITLPVNGLSMIADLMIEAIPLYSGSYTLDASTVSQELSTSDLYLASNIQINAFPVYSGSYTITPSTASINLSVSDLAMQSDLMIEAFPVYSGPYVISPSTSSITLSVSGLAMTADLTVEAFPETSLISKTITSNGIYSASSDDADGYSEVTVSVETYEFYRSLYYNELTELVGTEVSSVKAGMCLNNSALTIVDLPNVYGGIGTSAFANCVNLSSVKIDNATYIASSAFEKCTELESVRFDNVSEIALAAFRSCESLKSAYFSSVSTVTSMAFAYCTYLSDVYLENCSRIGASAFLSNYYLSIISLPNCTYLAQSAFAACRRLVSLYLMGPTICSLGSSVFRYSPISNSSSYAGRYGSIFVPASLYSDYITAPDWSIYSDRFVSVE